MNVNRESIEYCRNETTFANVLHRPEEQGLAKYGPVWPNVDMIKALTLAVE